ncbi:MAG: DUF2085 domain-containing protein [Chloroflexi bacterium]|nr:DUF2085 domain-containing protein [Chloroflexota bacterium]
MTTPIARPTTVANPGGLTTVITRHWLLIVILIWGLFVSLPWLAPVLMKLGAARGAAPYWTDAGKAIYTIYSFTCHQLPERSYFLFGPKAMYSLEEIQAAWQKTNNPIVLRRFIGNETMGWKVAWSDRMVSLYTSMLAGMILSTALRKRLPPLPIWAFMLLLVPMAVDGGTHAVSDVLGGGVGLGFRDSNTWLATMTSYQFPLTFYAGDAIGSFNWLMRLITGILMGLAVVWLILPMMDNWQGTSGE